MSTFLPKPKAILFDLMGTCCDWHSSLLPSLRAAPPLDALPPSNLSAFALEWRAGFFKEIHQRFVDELGTEDIDITHRRVLDRMLETRGVAAEMWGDQVRGELVRSWHQQTAWPDSLAGIERLKRDFFVVVLANGTTRLQLDIVHSARLPFDMLFSSQLLGLTKPDPAIYLKALELIGIEPHEAIMVAAHAYDLRAAAKVGIKTIYVHRSTEDLDEDMSLLRTEFDAFIEEADGLEGVAQLLGS